MGETVPHAPAGKAYEKVQVYYEMLRKQIEHEDNLCNNRMTWLIALQAFLFSAYGFSLGAEANTKPENLQFLSLIHQARFWFAILGVSSSLAILAALFAAILSVGRLVDKWYKFPDESVNEFPPIIGNSQNDLQKGMYLGQTPLIILPLISIVMWAKLSFNDSLQWYLTWGFTGLAILGGVYFLGFQVGNKRAHH